MAAPLPLVVVIVVDDAARPQNVDTLRVRQAPESIHHREVTFALQEAAHRLGGKLEEIVMAQRLEMFTAGSRVLGTERLSAETFRAGEPADYRLSAAFCYVGDRRTVIDIGGGRGQ